MRILYLMHVNWNWIKQRPQFIAEALTIFFNITILYPKNIYGKKTRFSTDRKSNLLNESKVKAFYWLPKGKFSLIRDINAIILNFLYIRFCKADIIWLPTPNYYRFLRIKKNQILVYDCMDDLLEFEVGSSKKNYLMKYEKKLMNDADLVLCSSEYLKQRLIIRYQLSRDIAIINNAISLNNSQTRTILNNDIKSIFSCNEYIKFVYIGTIAKWMDFDLIIKVLDKNVNIEFVFFGVCDVKIPIHPRLIYFGVINHENIFEVMKCSDALIMPFVVTELIRSVNPVKAYEYIYAYKPVIMARYGESEKFNNYVSLYSNENEFFEIIESIVEKRFKMEMTQEEHHLFAINNTWEKRAEEISKLIFSKQII